MFKNTEFILYLHFSNEDCPWVSLIENLFRNTIFNHIYIFAKLWGTEKSYLFMLLKPNLRQKPSHFDASFFFTFSKNKKNLKISSWWSSQKTSQWAKQIMKMKSFSLDTFLVLIISWGSDVSKCHNVYILSDYFIQFRTFPIVDS